MKTIKKMFRELKSQERALEAEIARLYKAQMSAIESEAKTYVGKVVSIVEPISRTMRGRLQYRITQIHRASRDFSYDSSGPVTLEYSAELVSKPKNYRGYHSRIVGKVYRKRISLARLATVKVVSK